MSCRLPEEEVYKNPNAQFCNNSFGRLRPIEEDGHRNDYQRDAHRIIYSQSFRRLRHKTQVFFIPNNDHLSTRLEHVIHVASAARAVARRLGFNEDLAEAIGLAHDIGHAPFGHHGEKVLDGLAKEHGLDINFEHELYGLRVVDKLAELDRDSEAGLNLTYEVREGIIAHCGEKKDREVFPRRDPREKIDLSTIKTKDEFNRPSTYEAAIVRLVDKIVWAGRDVEDAIHANFIKEKDIPNDVTKVLGHKNGKIIDTLLNDLVDYSAKHEDRIGLSEEMHQALNGLTEFNYPHIYNHDKIEYFKNTATRAITGLFEWILNDLKTTDRLRNNNKLHYLLNTNVYNVLAFFISKIGYNETDSNALIALDFIAGMTDNYLIRCIDEIFIPKVVA